MDRTYELLIDSYQDSMNFWRALGNETRYRLAKRDLMDVLQFRFEEMMEDRRDA